MRAIKITKQFKKDLKRECKGLYRATLERDLHGLFELLSKDAELPAKYADHQLGGKLRDCRDCSNLVLIYRKTAVDILGLIRLGSHSELCL